MIGVAKVWHYGNNQNDLFWVLGVGNRCIKTNATHRKGIVYTTKNPYIKRHRVEEWKKLKWKRYQKRKGTTNYLTVIFDVNFNQPSKPWSKITTSERWYEHRKYISSATYNQGSTTWRIKRCPNENNSNVGDTKIGKCLQMIWQ